MSTTTTTKFYVQAQLAEGGPFITYGLDSFSSHEEAVRRVNLAMPELPNAHAFRITRETITTSFTAYQPITNPAK